MATLLFFFFEVIASLGLCITEGMFSVKTDLGPRPIVTGHETTFKIIFEIFN
jgi:hypothetical protein